MGIEIDLLAHVIKINMLKMTKENKCSCMTLCLEGFFQHRKARSFPDKFRSL